MPAKTKEFAIEKLFNALADRTRLRLLNLMADGEVCVCFFVDVLQQSQPKISRHLAYLRNAGVVATRRDGKWMHYSIVEPSAPYAMRIFNEVRNWLAEDEEMQRDRKRLEKVYSDEKVPRTLKYAPRPLGSVTQDQPVALAAESIVHDEAIQPVRKNNSFQNSNWLDYD
jgi:ArsR family transcriptional regulator